MVENFGTIPETLGYPSGSQTVPRRLSVPERSIGGNIITESG